MKNSTSMLALGLGIAAICGAPYALADSQTGSVGAPLPFSAYDRDGNGSIDKQEFDSREARQARDRAAAGAPMGGAANTTTFEELDRNGDGQITAAEFVEVRSAMPQGNLSTGIGLSAGKGGFMGGPGASFSDLDTNGDGFISATEFNTARANRAVERSQQGDPLGTMRNAPSLADLDRNGDEQLSPDELAAAQAGYSQQPQNPGPR